MARLEPEVVVMQSVLDRLIDDEPQTQAAAPITRAQSYRQFKASLRRDLEWLLNTRQTPVPAEEHEAVAQSVFNYGLPDTSAISVRSGADCDRLQAFLGSAIATYEPRLANVKVSLEPVAGAVRVLRFRIEGLMRIDPAPEHISFDTVLELSTGQYAVK